MTTSNFKDLEPKLKEKEVEYSVNATQKRLWWLSQLEGSSMAYNNYDSFTFNYDEDSIDIKEVLSLSIQRHEILRTTFFINDQGIILQRVLSFGSFSYELEIKDLSNNVEPMAKIRKYISEDRYKPFNLEKGPLFRSTLFKISKNHSILYLNLHEIIGDVRSIGILAEEIKSHFEPNFSKYISKEQSSQIQYKDYVSKEKDSLESNSNKESASFWCSVLKQEVSRIDLPTSKRRPKLKTFNGQRMAVRISNVHTKKLTNFCVAKNCNLDDYLIAVWTLLLYRYSGSKDILIGRTLDQRSFKESLNFQIGCYTNVTPLRISINPKDNFNTYFERFLNNVNAVNKHKAYPFDLLIEQLAVSRDIARNPLIDIIVNFSEIASSNLNSNQESIMDLGGYGVQYDMELDLMNTEEGLDILLTFNSDVYEYQMIEVLLTHYKRLLKQCIKGSKVALGEIDFLSTEQKRYIIQTGTSKVHYPKDITFLDLFEKQVTDAPDAIALIYKEEFYTYKSLDEVTNKVARYLVEVGIKKNAFIPICADSPIDFVIAVLSIAKSGNAYVPISADYPIERIEYIVKDIGAQIALTHSDHIHLFENQKEYLKLACLDNLLPQLTDLSAAPLNLHISPKELAYVIYTSGTTGVPKGVMLEHQSLLDYLYGFLDELSIKTRHSYALMSAMPADSGNTILFSSLITGGILHLFSSEDLMDSDFLLSYFNKNDIDITKMVPSHWHALNYNRDIILPRKVMIFGGEALPPKVIKKIKNSSSKATVYNHYGPTETAIGKLMYKIDIEKEYGNVPIGKPFSNTEIFVLNEFQQLSPIGVKGELYIGGDGLARGYLNKPKTTADKFISHPFSTGQKIYKTGDVTRLLPDGNIEFLGRKDDQVKVNGHRIELGEITTILNTHPLVEQAIVLSNTNDQGSNYLLSYVVTKSALDFDNLKELLVPMLKEKLPSYMIPNIFIPIGSTPFTANGKVDRKSLPSPDDFSPKRNASYVAPRTQTEKKIERIWCQILNIDQIGIKNDFFSLGGDSLTGILCLNNCFKEFEVKVSIKDFFDHSILAEFAKYIDFILSQKRVDIESLNQIEI